MTEFFCGVGVGGVLMLVIWACRSRSRKLLAMAREAPEFTLWRPIGRD